jgi:glycosyltransferase involved in cell wall biosynthesis
VTSISVAMTTCNGEDYVAEQLRSIATQTRPPDEVVICDDRSTDRTLAVVESVLAEAPFKVEVVTNPARLGVVANVEQAIRRTTGDIIVLADQDDIWRPERLARLEGIFAARTQVDALFSDAVIVDQWSKPTGDRLWKCIRFTKRRHDRWASDPVGVLLQGNVVTGASLAFRASLISVILPIATSGWHDLWIATLIAATGRIDAIDEPLLAYRVHGHNAAGVPGSARVERDRRLAQPTERLEALRQMESIIERLEERGFGHAPAVSDLRAKAHHLASRTRLPVGVISRAFAVARATAGRRYHLYAAGFGSALFDLAYGGRLGLTLQEVDRDAACDDRKSTSGTRGPVGPLRS